MAAIDDLLESTLKTLREQPVRPTSTYRLQFHAGFTFRDALAIVPYLEDLGITHCYASPYLKARPSSKHGYDIIDHSVLNPELGGEPDYKSWVQALRQRNMGHILDLVANHMGIAGNDNAWWNDVLENGPSSPYANYFDIDWESSHRPELQQRVLLPVLAEPYGKALESQQICLAFDGGAFTIRYFDHRFPVAPSSYARILADGIDDLEAAVGAGSEPLIEYQSILTAIKNLPGHTETDPLRVAERQREKEVVKRRLAALADASSALRAFIDRRVTRFNGQRGDPHSFDLLDQLLTDQAYRLANWRVAADEINYRRFFDVNELAALSMERPEVFAATHALIFRLLGAGLIDGLRIDHPDGLYDPRQYLQWLQQHYIIARVRAQREAQPDFREEDWPAEKEMLLAKVATVGNPLPLYIVVEKILGKDEPLPAEWPVHGTSGYDFLNMANGVFIAADHASALTRMYYDWIQGSTPFAELVRQKKFLILQVFLCSELHMLGHQLDRLAQKDRASRDFTLTSLRHALREIIVCFPVYRSYITDENIRPEDSRYVQTAVKRAGRRNPVISPSLFDFIADMLLLKYPETATVEDRARQRRFVGKFQQVTGPVMAKGMEDTACYVYNRLLALNEVGGSPDRLGVAPAAFHGYNQERQERWPLALSALSTHDTKRSEDARARLSVLSELPEAWLAGLRQWSASNAAHRIALDDQEVPEANDEYFLYQTLIGAWPLEPYSTAEYADFVSRIQAYMEKAMHEAKVHTSWINPNPPYDEAMRRFIGVILAEDTGGPFLRDFRAFQRRISHYGLFNSLAQTVLKLAAPGVPDTYQGTEVWDFSLVDPDNRRPVDYEHRRRLLGDLQAWTKSDSSQTALARELTETKEDGRIKLYVTWRALHCRRDNPDLFATGEYLPLEVDGTRANHVLAFLRRRGQHCALALVPRLLTRLIEGEPGLPLGESVWHDTRLLLPQTKPGIRWQNVFTGELVPVAHHDGQASLAVADLLRHFPVALLLADA
jgi:(1->4)-alpha-D-glucan 1-alpha-D-glucosylmutase